jgi:Rrf2 family protein
MLRRGMHLSLQIQYAVCGVFDLAYNGHGAPVQIRVIGERQGIPPRYLEQIFQRLRRARIVLSKRGPGGGYTLARPPAEITLRDVVEAVEGPLVGRSRRGGCVGRGGAAPAHRPAFLWPLLAQGFADVLARTSFEAICRDAAKARVRRAESDAPMYHI